MRITKASYSKLGLTKTENGNLHPTVSGVLLSEPEIKNKIFPYSKIECARFKGTKTDVTIDSKTIDEVIPLKSERILGRKRNETTINGWILSSFRREKPD